ncbi:protein MKS1-like [Actinidia eriantha]|uniref:protein MKS1-like n=1 Tax=Actinidia eriantha TaxID=165200 RepID=UPI00258CEFC4|nr:protein MKS1-like [Actinidia eriantha]
MDPPAGNSPRRELLGPRPPPLRVHKDSHKIKKPPLVPAHHHHRPPVIIYTVSPKVIHTNPSEFMKLVQRLTGTSSTCLTGGISPAARLASTEKTKMPLEKKNPQNISDMGMAQDGVEISTELERTSLFPGILSPGPGALQPIPPNFFSPPSDHPSPMSFFQGLSPLLQGNKNFMEGSFMSSPSNLFTSQLTSPTPSLDLFSNFFDI